MECLVNLEDGGDKSLRQERSIRNSGLYHHLTRCGAYILALCFTAVNPAALLDPGNDAGGYAVAQIFYQVFKDRYGSGTGGIFALGIIAVAVYFCSAGCILSNSR